MRDQILNRLTIYTGAFSYELLGGEALRTAYNTWRDGCYSEAKRFTVEGFEDNARLSPKCISLDPDTIIGVELTGG